MSNYPVTHYFVGFDLGRDRDHSAIAVLALRREDHGPFDHARVVQPTRLVLQLGALQRIPLGTEYLDVIRTLRDVVQALKTSARWGMPQPRIYIVIDSAGPGQVAIELIRAQNLGVDLVTTLLTGGHETGFSQSGKLTIPRRDIVTNLRYLLEVQLLRVHSGLTHCKAFEAEVAAVRPEGGQSAHDDLVIAAGLAAWHAARVHPDLVRAQRVA